MCMSVYMSVCMYVSQLSPLLLNCIHSHHAVMIMTIHAVMIMTIHAVMIMTIHAVMIMTIYSAGASAVALSLPRVPFLSFPFLSSEM